MRALLFIFLLFLFTLSAGAQAPSFLQTLCHDSLPEIYLKLDWKNLIKTKKEKAYQATTIKYASQGHDTITLEGKIRTRGHMRLDICAIPPIKIKLEKGDLTRCQLSSMNEMDIVHHCHDSEQYDQYLLREYLAYKLWEIVSPHYLKTQIIQLHYINPDGSPAYDPSYAFIVEHEEEMLARLNARTTKTTVISEGAVNKKSFLRTCLFQFMIGNTDWYIPTRHNLVFAGIPGHTLLQTIPYDFDYAGLVNATYAAAHESLKLSSTSIRYYQGWCNPEEEVQASLQVFRDHKQKILEMPTRIPGLDEKSIQYTVHYLSEFFEIIENPKKVQSQIVKHCGMWPVN